MANVLEIDDGSTTNDDFESQIKTCKICKEQKSIDEFYGHASYCMECVKAKSTIRQKIVVYANYEKKYNEAQKFQVGTCRFCLKSIENEIICEKCLAVLNKIRSKISKEPQRASNTKMKGMNQYFYDGPGFCVVPENKGNDDDEDEKLEKQKEVPTAITEETKKGPFSVCEIMVSIKEIFEASERERLERKISAQIETEIQAKYSAQLEKAQFEAKETIENLQLSLETQCAENEKLRLELSEIKQKQQNKKKQKEKEIEQIKKEYEERLKKLEVDD